MKISSAKAKGRRAAQKVREWLLGFALELEPDDVQVTSSGVTGRDLTLSPAAQKIYPFAIEVKNVEKLNVREAFAQAKAHVRKISEIPILFHTRNHDEMLVTIGVKDFLQLVRNRQYADRSGELAETNVHEVPGRCETEGASF